MGGQAQQSGCLSGFLLLEERVPAYHPLLAIPQMIRVALAESSARSEALYGRVGRWSVPREQLLRELLLQVLCSVPSERLLMAQLEYNLLLRWFVGLGMDDPVRALMMFKKNRERLQVGRPCRTLT